MEVGVLGPTRVLRGAEVVDLGTRKQRALLAALALHAGRAVSVDAIIDLLWGDGPPPGVTATLQSYVAGLRRALEPTRAPRTPAALLVTVTPGYALRVERDDLDAARFASGLAAQHQRLGPVSALVPTGRARVTRDDLSAVVAELDQVLDLWRGEAYAELDDVPDARSERVRLTELRLLGLEDRALAHCWLGHSATVAVELESLTSAFPLRERLWGLRALALTRAGRQAEALEVLRTVRELLDDELGLEPGPELRSLQTAVLRQDEALDWLAPDVSVNRPPSHGAARSVTAEGTARAGTERGPTAAQPVEPPTAEIAGTDGQAPVVRTVQGWPMVGRHRELETLIELLSGAAAGTATFAGVVGEPGIGKSRLASELIAVARARQVTVLSGRGSQDDGAPPLWPWRSVLGGLGEVLPVSATDTPEVSQFEAWQQVVAQIRHAARRRPLLVVLDDLHWVDTASLRVLRLLMETGDHDDGVPVTRPGSPPDHGDTVKLMVLLTWRPHPEPSGALADALEMLARRHAPRLALVGLTATETDALVTTVGHVPPNEAQAEALRERTDGNPFYLVEYARLAAEGGDLGGLLVAGGRPAGVHDVLVRRLARLPEATVLMLRLASVVGRQFDLRTCAIASGTDEEAVLDLLEPAQAAGLVREDGIDQFSFAHALVRDTAYTEVFPSRRARLHARVAQALEQVPGRETELARHWFAAGPGYVDRAWRAAVVAADRARHVHAHDESAGLLDQALTAMAADPTAEPLDCYAVLARLIDAYRWTARWPELVQTAERAVTVAEQIGDVALVAGAAMATSIGTLWQSAPVGQVHRPVVDALRRCLERLPADDGAVRARVMLSLANETYWGAGCSPARLFRPLGRRHRRTPRGTRPSGDGACGPAGGAAGVRGLGHAPHRRRG